MRIFLIFLISSFTSALFYGQATQLPINQVLGDESYVAVMGQSPGANEDEQWRITLHLFYTEQLLRAKNIEGLSITQIANREGVLNLLREYWQAGIFPANYDYLNERRPCFIDRNGNICAVGYLVEKTAGREVAEFINKQHQYEYIMQMNEPVVAAWAYENGLSLEECAMIQPAYGPFPPTGLPANTVQENIKTGYGITSGVLGGTNLAFNVINLSNRYNDKKIAYLGFITGTGQIVAGALNIKKDKQLNEGTGWGNNYTASYKAQNNLSYLNIAMGTSTIITSTLNLIINKNCKNKKTAFTLYSYPNNFNKLSTGFVFTKRI